MSTLLLAGLIIVLLLVLLSRSESFDTYYNHDIGANEVLEMDGIPTTDNPLYDAYRDDPVRLLSVPDATLESKYFWNSRDHNGLKLYDKYYEKLVKDEEYPATSYALEINEDDKYDTKFDILDLNPITSNNLLAVYTTEGMYDYNPAKITKYYNTMELSQKNF